jgi:spore germination cell wall hydrolase CwlJ-like protein
MMRIAFPLSLRLTASKGYMVAALAVTGSAATYAILGSPPAAARVEAPMTRATAAALMRATSSPASTELEAIGDRARVINAALPFSASPVEAARPFLVPAQQVDERRALECLSQAVYYEAGYEPLQGRRAVAQVVLNRVRHPAYPNSICGVVYQHSRSRVCQFTFVCDGALHRRPEAGAWRQARAIAEAALQGYIERSVGLATHYHANYVAPRWAPMLAKVSQIGAHIFYRWPGSWGQPRAFASRYVGEPHDPASLRPSQMDAVPQDLTAPELAAVEGPPVRRAPTDVGGLLDTSKGWKLNIPDPRETASSATRVIAGQKAGDSASSAPVAVSSASAPTPGGRTVVK